MSRILFQMPYPGHLRLYGTTIVALAERGHDVLLAYDKLKHVPGERLVPDDAPPAVQAVEDVPPHGGRWSKTLRDLGCVADYVRFLSARRAAPYLRARMERYLPARFEWLRRVHAWPAWAVDWCLWGSRAVERLIPVDRRLVRYIEGLRPDAVVVTPLVIRGPGGAQQTQFVKAAKRLRVPVALGVGSWDHLSSKGAIRTDLDQVIVWNEIQRDEAEQMHRVPRRRVVVTGAQPFDGWFGRTPSLNRADFMARVGLPADRPMILYAGSSRGIARPDLEIAFVRRWLAAVRAAADPALRTAAVLIRPHYSNMAAWENVTWPEAGAAVVWPRTRPALPMTDAEAADYFHSIHFSAAVVGINTSAMIEASVIGRPVYTVEAPEFVATQGGTVHFHYLLPAGGGCVQTAPSFEAHVEQLARGLADPAHDGAARARFVERFVRPNGIDRPALGFVVDAIERLAQDRSRVAAWAPREARAR